MVSASRKTKSPRSEEMKVIGIHNHKRSVAKVVKNRRIDSRYRSIIPCRLNEEYDEKNELKSICVLVADKSDKYYPVGFIAKKDIAISHELLHEKKPRCRVTKNQGKYIFSVEFTKPKDSHNNPKTESENDQSITRNSPPVLSSKSVQRKRSKFNFSELFSFVFLSFFSLVSIVSILYLLNLIFPVQTVYRDYIKPAISPYDVRTYDVSATITVTVNAGVGHDWSSYDLNVNVNGKDMGTENIALKSGDIVLLSGFVREMDSIPDVSSFESDHFIISKEDIQRGFVLKVPDIRVVEKGGKNNGQSAFVTVEFHFEPVD